MQVVTKLTSFDNATFSNCRLTGSERTSKKLNVDTLHSCIKNKRKSHSSLILFKDILTATKCHLFNACAIQCSLPGYSIEVREFNDGK